jgi:rhodanese-related sulfurtransferase
VRALLRQSVLLLGLAFLPAAVQGLYFRDRILWEARVPESDMVPVELARSWGADAIWIDARPEADFEREHVPDAILLNEDRWNELLPQFLQQRWSPEKKLVVYCSAENCNLAGDVARRLREEAKLPNQIRVLKGGWEEWLRTRQ